MNVTNIFTILGQSDWCWCDETVTKPSVHGVIPPGEAVPRGPAYRLRRLADDHRRADQARRARRVFHRFARRVLVRAYNFSGHGGTELAAETLPEVTSKWLDLAGVEDSTGHLEQASPTAKPWAVREFAVHRRRLAAETCATRAQPGGLVSLGRSG